MLFNAFRDFLLTAEGPIDSQSDRLGAHTPGAFAKRLAAKASKIAGKEGAGKRPAQSQHEGINPEGFRIWNFNDCLGFSVLITAYVIEYWFNPNVYKARINSQLNIRSRTRSTNNY